MLWLVDGKEWIDQLLYPPPNSPPVVQDRIVNPTKPQQGGAAYQTSIPTMKGMDKEMSNLPVEIWTADKEMYTETAVQAPNQVLDGKMMAYSA